MLDGGEHKMSRRGGETVANKYTSARAPLWEEVCKILDRDGARGLACLWKKGTSITKRGAEEEEGGMPENLHTGPSGESGAEGEERKEELFSQKWEEEEDEASELGRRRDTGQTSSRKKGERKERHLRFAPLPTTTCTPSTPYSIAPPQSLAFRSCVNFSRREQNRVETSVDGEKEESQY